MKALRKRYVFRCALNRDRVGRFLREVGREFQVWEAVYAKDRSPAVLRFVLGGSNVFSDAERRGREGT